MRTEGGDARRERIAVGATIVAFCRATFSTIELRLLAPVYFLAAAFVAGVATSGDSSWMNWWVFVPACAVAALAYVGLCRLVDALDRRSYARIAPEDRGDQANPQIVHYKPHRGRHRRQ